MIPLSFVVGAAMGAAGTYVAKDEPAKQWVIETGKKLKEAAVSFMDSMKKKQEVATGEATVEVTTATAGTGQTVEGTVVTNTDQPQETNKG
ncbi:MAG: hypothetical protein JG718_05775 [Candidatus Thiothrix moscowensis]|nr:hypothetical protein [Candidatus Thiothrix moscowensis]